MNFFVDITSHSKRGGHAVVLIRCDPNCLTFMNSWGQEFADSGFFRVKDQKVLNDTTFFDVYWTEDDLEESEKLAYKKSCTERAKQVSRIFTSTQDLPYKCPKCDERSRVSEFSGNIIEAECPKCHEKFKPTGAGILHALYTRNMDF